MDSSATVPVNTIRSPHERLSPYFCLMGHSSRRALSKFWLSGHESSGANRCSALLAPPRPSLTRYVPAACQAMRTKNGP